MMIGKRQDKLDIGVIFIMKARCKVNILLRVFGFIKDMKTIQHTVELLL